MNIDVTKMPKECQCCKGTGIGVNDFHSKVSWLREEAGLTQGEMAEALELKRTTITNMESGRTFATPDILISIHNYFGVSIDWLLGVKDG